jgi:4a-hydroxytetrahydrobiopterin dehydratase
MTVTELQQGKCSASPTALSSADVARFLSALPGWELAEDGRIRRSWRFADFHRTMAFVNAVAWVAHQQDHHPNMKVSYNKVTVSYTTHFARGLSINDFICAAKLNGLMANESE